ncbi:ANTAR domain-containing protein, partial [Acidimicrobiaceae bacterium USS-CC1]|nr:ANTAR domain-containing protein [Acidiferrimicrobium australe]
VPDGRILYTNPAACALLRASAAEISRRGRQGFAPPGDPQWKAAVEERARTGRVHFVGPMLRADGSRFVAEVSSSIFTGADGQEHAIVIIRDSTRQIRLQQRSSALQEITGALLAGASSDEVLTMVGHHARLLLDASDAAIFTAGEAPGHVVVAAVDGRAITALAGRDYGPTSLAARTMAQRCSVVVDDLTEAATTSDGRRVGLGPGILAPIVAGTRAFGALMVGAEPGSPPYDGGDLEDVRVFAESAAVALELGEARAAVEAAHRRTAEQLQRALESRIVLEQAKGFIAASRGVGPDEAFARLRGFARRHNASVHETASRVMDRTLLP